MYDLAKATSNGNSRSRYNSRGGGNNNFNRNGGNTNFKRDRSDNNRFGGNDNISRFSSNDNSAANGTATRYPNDLANGNVPKKVNRFANGSNNGVREGGTRFSSAGHQGTTRFSNNESSSRFTNNDSYKSSNNDFYQNSANKFKANGYENKPKTSTLPNTSGASGTNYPTQEPYGGMFAYPPPPIH